jgi:hypothetical protein
MAIIHVRAVIDFRVDTDQYAAARRLEELDDTIEANEHEEIAHEFLTIEQEELVERWAWHCVQLTDEYVLIKDEPFPIYPGEISNATH